MLALPFVVRIEKLQVNKQAKTPVVSDYFIQTPKADFFVECKEVKMSRKDVRFNFIQRFTQEKQMLEYHNNPGRNFCFLFLVFWNTNKNNSDAFLIRMEDWEEFRKQNWVMKSLTLEQTFKFFPHSYIQRTPSAIWNFNISSNGKKVNWS